MDQETLRICCDNNPSQLLNRVCTYKAEDQCSRRRVCKPRTDKITPLARENFLAASSAPQCQCGGHCGAQQPWKPHHVGVIDPTSQGQSRHPWRQIDGPQPNGGCSKYCCAIETPQFHSKARNLK
jgi:hypothetical protein